MLQRVSTHSHRTMPTNHTRWLALLSGVALLNMNAPLAAQDSGPLLDLLVRKGIVSPQEAEDVRAELAGDFATNTPAGKLNLSSALTEFKIGGDVRVRYENRSGETATGDEQQRDRFRYRFRAGFTGRVMQDWGYGFRLETGSGNRSSNVTLGTDAGPWSKNDDGVYIGQIYASWNPSSNFSLIAGRMPNPLIGTSMMWDGDLNPEGLAEHVRLRRDDLELFGTFGQFVYSGANTQNPFNNPVNVKDLYLFAWQGGVRYSLPGGRRLQVAPTLYHYVGTDQARNPQAFRGAFSPTNPTAVNNLFILDVPVEYTWMINDRPVRAFGDFAINFDAEQRAAKWGRPDLDGENLAWHVGFQYGKAANPGEWDARVFYQSVGTFALDPNLVDSDLFDSRTNMEGFAASFNYALGTATQLTITAATGDRKNNTIVAAGSGDIGSNNTLENYWLLQTDLNLKF